MSKLLQGKVIYENVSHNNCLQKFIEKQIAKWVIKQSGVGSAEGALLDSDFKVRFEKIGSTHSILCRLEIFTGEQLWTGFSEAAHLDQALLKTLQHMHLVSNPAFQPPWVEKRVALSQAS